MRVLEESLIEALERSGYSRREFLKFCAGVAALLGLPAGSAAEMARALQDEKRPVLVWLEFQDCAGNTESFLLVATGRERQVDVIGAAAFDRTDALQVLLQFLAIGLADFAL